MFLESILDKNVFLYDQPGEHFVTAILKSYLPQKNLDPLPLETPEVLRLILGLHLLKKLFSITEETRRD